MTTNEERQLGRAKDAVLTFLENKLIVPKIYLDADWDGQPIDRPRYRSRWSGGSSRCAALRAHATPAMINWIWSEQERDEEEKTVRVLIERFKSIPANYKYIGAVDTKDHCIIPRFLINIDESLFSPDFIGRIGLLHINATPKVEEPIVDFRVRPERFRAKIAKLADEYVQQHEADWEIRALNESHEKALYPGTEEVGRPRRACDARAYARPCPLCHWPGRDRAGHRAGPHGRSHRHRLSPLHQERQPVLGGGRRRRDRCCGHDQQPAVGLRPDHDRVHLGRWAVADARDQAQALPDLLRRRASHLGADLRVEPGDAGGLGAHHSGLGLRPGGPQPGLPGQARRRLQWRLRLCCAICR